MFILQITVAFAVVAMGESFLPPKTTQPVNPCSKVLCMAGTKCVVQNGKPRCVQVDPCATVRCGNGTKCIVKGGKAYCQTGNCPPDKPRHYCLIPPCVNAKCPAYSDAKCVDNHCGGCNADFYIGGKKVKCGQCPPYKPRHYCLIPPCNNAKCPAYPDAKCVDNYCGGCNADFYVGDTKVNCACRPPLAVHQCKVAPCDLVSNCPAYPKAKCVNNYCGGCFADFYLNGRKVDCKK